MSSSTMKITVELQFWWCQLEGKPGSTHTYETSSHIYFTVKVLEHCILLQCHFSQKFHTVSPRLSNISVNSRRRITPPAVNSWKTITSQHNCITPLLSEADNIRKRKTKTSWIESAGNQGSQHLSECLQSYWVLLKNNINPQQIHTARLCTSMCQGIDGFADCQVKIQTEKHFFILQEITATNQKDDSVMATFKITQKFFMFCSGA